MAISFQLNLNPGQIELLQQLDLYADGKVTVLEAMDRFRCWVTMVRRLVAEGLVTHIAPQHGDPDGTRYYRITDKGRTVLGLIEQDVQAFLARQRAYQKAKGRKPA